MTIDNVYHMAGGVALGLVFWCLGWHSAAAFCLAIGFGFGREVYQHLDRPFPWLNLHNVGESISWGAGAGLVGLVRWLS